MNKANELLLNGGEIVYIGFGSNLAPREVYLKKAVEAISGHPDCAVKAISSVYETKPLGSKAGSNFLNLAVELCTLLPPKGLFLLLKEIEKSLGRKERERWADREIDLDVLLYGKRIIEEDGLRIPHQSMNERDFVLVPLLELNPDLLRPDSHQRLQDIEAALAERFIIRKTDISL